MKISVIMAACNQGTFLKETVESAIQGLDGCKDYEIIIIDDQSDDGCCDLVEQSDQVKVFRPAEKLGVSHARRLAGTMATGDVIMTTDSHCYYPRRCIWRMAHWAVRQRAIILPQVKIERSGGAYTPVQGGKLTISPRGLRTDRPSRARENPSLYGSIYLMSRMVWDWIGGWIGLPGYWGGEEVINSVLAYRFGIPIVVVAKHECTHRMYREHAQYPWPLPNHHPSDITHYIHAACFPDTYPTIWNPLIRFHYPKWMPNPNADPEPLRQWIDERAVMDEHKFFKLMFGLDDLAKHPVIKQCLTRISKLERTNAGQIPIDEPNPSVHPNEPKPVAPGSDYNI